MDWSIVRRLFFVRKKDKKIVKKYTNSLVVVL